MKTKIICLLLVIGANFLNAQVTNKEDVIKIIGTKSCACATEKEDLKDTPDFIQKVIVPCIVYATHDNLEIVKKAYKDVNLNESTFITANFKEIIIEMAHNCPIIFSSFITKEDLKKGTQFITLNGSIIKITNEQFTTVSVKDNSGITQDYLVLSDFKGSNLLIENKLKKGDVVSLLYGEIKLYDAKAKSFKDFKVIKSIEKK